MAIDHINLGQIDLNLLVAFDALIAEQSVTRAAARIGLRQSAMSHNLARLRTLFGDELLVRGPQGMRITPRAAALAAPVRSTLAQIQDLVSRQEEFVPATAERVFRIGMSDSMEVLLVPALLALIQRTAPGIRLRLHTVDFSQLLDDLDTDRFDLAIGIGSFLHGQTHHKQRLLFTESYLCMFSAEQTGLKPPISLDDYIRLPHILTSLRPGERGVVDDALAPLGLTRSVALTTAPFPGSAFPGCTGTGCDHDARPAGAVLRRRTGA